MCSYLVPKCCCVLPTCWRWWKNDHVYLNPSCPRCLSSPRLKDPSSNIFDCSAHRQISPLYFHHEHSYNSSSRCHHKLELSNTDDSSDAILGETRLSQLSSKDVNDETTSSRPALGNKVVQQTWICLLRESHELSDGWGSQKLFVWWGSQKLSVWRSQKLSVWRSQKLSVWRSQKLSVWRSQKLSVW